MELIQIATILSKFGADVVIVAVAVYLLTFALKKTLLKKTCKKYLTFVPFLLGIVLYALFSMLVNLSAEPIISSFPLIAQKGVASGSAATIIHIVYEQFVRGEKLSYEQITENYITEIISGYVQNLPEGLAKKIASLSNSDEIRGELKVALPQLSNAEIESILTLLGKIL